MPAFVIVVGFLVFLIVLQTTGVVLHVQRRADKRRSPNVLESAVSAADRQITRGWRWVLDVVFGATAAFGFENLQASVRAATTPAQLSTQIVAALGLYAFFLYDVSALHILTRKYPYHVSLKSGCRYFLDVCMAFLLMLTLIPGLQVHPEQSNIVILTALTIWHFAAFAWHLLANWERGTAPTMRWIVTHFGFVAIYWTVFGAWCSFQWLLSQEIDPHAVELLWLIAFTVGLIAAWRIQRVIQLFHREIQVP